MAFIRNVKRADEAIRVARQTKPAFDRFLQVGASDYILRTQRKRRKYVQYNICCALYYRKK